MKRDILVRTTEMTGPVKVHHLQRLSQVFRSDRTDGPFHFISIRNFRNFGLNGKCPFQLLVENSKLDYLIKAPFLSGFRYSTKHLNDDTTPKNIKALLV